MTNIKYNLSKPTPPAMPRLGKGTECVQLLLSQVSKDMHQPLVPMLFSILGAHVSGAEFMYPDKNWKEMCGMLANLVADSGAEKGQLLGLVEALCRDFRAPSYGEGTIDSYIKKIVLQRTLSYDCHPRMSYLCIVKNETSAHPEQVPKDSRSHDERVTKP